MPDTVTQAGSEEAAKTDERPVFFIHIPKTGGNTVVSHFLAFLPVEQIFPPPPQLTLLGDDFAQARARLAGLRFLHGHLRVGVAQLLPLDKLRLLTFVRNPVRLVASHYLYFRHMPELPMHKAAKALGIAEFLRLYPTYGTNPQTRYLTQALGMRKVGEPFQPSDHATAALERFDFVGVTERMQESLDALSMHYGVPSFPSQRLNEGRASHDEVEACEAVLRKDEFLMRLGADFVLRREAEERFDRWQTQRRAAQTAATLLAGLRGTAPMPWVLAQAEDAAVTFLDGWHAQGWVGEPGPGNHYWWTRESARILLVSASGRPLDVKVRVLETMGFDAATIRAAVNGKPLRVAAALSNPGVELDFRIDAETLARNGNAVTVHLIGPRSRTFAEVDPATEDHRRRSFAIRAIEIGIAAT